MASMRKLNRRLSRWTRYAFRTYWNPRISRPTWMGPNSAMSPSHTRAWNAREKERERRQCFRFYRPVYACFDCGLPDLHHGQGDGIGSCECSRCAECGAPPQGCDCAWTEDDWSDDEPDDDAGHGDDWPPGVVMPRVETEHAFSEAGLL